MFACVVFYGCSKDDNGNGDTVSPQLQIITPQDGDTISFPQLVTVEVSGENIVEVIFTAEEDTFAKLQESPYSTYWPFYMDTGIVTLKVYARDDENRVGSDSIVVFVPEQDFDFPLVEIAKSSHNVYLGWWKFDELFFDRYDIYVSQSGSVDSTDELVARIEGRINDTCAFIDNLQPETDYMFIAYAYAQTGSCWVSNQLPVRTKSPQPTYDDGAELISIPADTFTMGYSWSEGGGGSEEYPAHPVKINSFNIYKYEVTCAQYKQFIDEGGYSDPEWWDSSGWMWKENNEITAPAQWNDPEFPCGDDFPNYPVIGVTWYEAMAYANFVGRTLPTEAQWEYVARGTLGTDEDSDGYPEGYKFPWGNEFFMDDEIHCNYLYESGDPCGDDGFDKTAPVGSFPNGASIFGAMDMSGNVAEWCMDWFDNTYYWEHPFDNPTGPETGTQKSVRGGHYLLTAGMATPGFYHRTSARDKLQPHDSRYFIGFRLVEN